MTLEGVAVRFPVAQGLRRRSVTALAPTDLAVERGETLAVVGESGSGKTTLGRAMLRLVEPAQGEIRFEGTDLAALSPRALRALRPRLQMVFQDPYASLNPRRTVRAALRDALSRGGVPRHERDARAAALMEDVGLPADALDRLPAAFSGGQRQRIAIARALATGPDLIVADEPISALDVSIQAQVVNLLTDLKDARGLTLVFISHDLGMVAAIADRVAVLYFGHLVELRGAAELARAPAHPYTAMLLAAMPRPDVAAARAAIDAAAAAPAAELPSQIEPPAGCPFRGRCPRALDACARTMPPLVPVPGVPGGAVACHNPLLGETR